MNDSVFLEKYSNLNPAQKEAVDAIDGPVMVVAGPGTGKTEVLALRIAHILKKTDTPADGVLCLTFTNSGVSAMRERLRRYIGKDSSRVEIHTFHRFAFKIIEEFHSVIGFDESPQTLKDHETVSLFDAVLHGHDWAHLRPRSNSAKYYGDLKSVLSLLKRERIAPEDLKAEIESDIEKLKNDPENISSRGATKGQLKQDAIKKIEGLEKTLEVVDFYRRFEQVKRDANFVDYDDIIEYAGRIIDESEDARDSIRERYLYVLVDEHQDSNGTQNALLQKIWKGTESPNIFVVGDDRQLIYGFSGADISYFESFKHLFGNARVITLVTNYRSTQDILDVADELLQSHLASGKLMSNTDESHPLDLVACDYPRDEVIAAGLEMKKRIAEGADPNDCVLLVPKNRQVVSAVQILGDLGLPVSRGGLLYLFDLRETLSLLRVLKIIANSADSVSLSESLLDPLADISPLSAHRYLSDTDTRKLSLSDLLQMEKRTSLFAEDNDIKNWSDKLHGWITRAQSMSVYEIVQMAGDELLIQTASDHEALVRRIEVVRTMLHLALAQMERAERLSLSDFIAFIDRMLAYGEDVPLAVFSADEGIKVMTLHGSKGLEFESVWIAHMDEKSLMKGKKGGFALPMAIEKFVSEKDEASAKRELFVAITRAKRYCTVSYSRYSHSGGDQELAHIIHDLPEGAFHKKSFAETEAHIIEHDPRSYVSAQKVEYTFGSAELKDLVSKEYDKARVSVTLLNNFFECPRKWYFRNLLQLPEHKSESLQFGSIVHDSVDKAIKLGHQPSSKELEQIVAGEVLRQKFMDDAKDARITREALSIVARWTKARLPELSPSRENEKSISYNDPGFPHLSIYGKIDLIENMGGKSVQVTDFKTGSPKTKSEVEKLDSEKRMSPYMRQLAMYSYLLQRNPKWGSEVSLSRLEFLESKDAKNAFYDTRVDAEQVELLLRDIRDYDALLKSGEWLDRECHYNSYGKNTECEYCALMKQIIR